MPIIALETTIEADIERCFDLARSIDLHKLSTKGTQEIAVAGVTSGLIGLDETVTWEATHFAIRQRLTTRITAFTRPFHFRDEQIKGAFRSLVHDHYFESAGSGTLMTDTFNFSSPYGIVGRLFDRLLLTGYMRKFLVQRNLEIKKYAEGRHPVEELSV